ncbi:MAG: AAA family ATPase [Candidatus Zhuqueibacterota bacterium]
MKLAISGKGGVGKTTLAAALSLLLVRRGHKVLALDADPDANLASALGLSAEQQAQIVPISRQVALIEARTGAKVKQYGQIFKLNPEVSDIAGSYAVTHRGVNLLVLGAVQQGGGGCACPENILIKALVTDLVLFKNETLIMDMEAGIEHLGRGTARGVDSLLIVLEPGLSSVESTRRIMNLAAEIGLKDIRLVANKVAGQRDEEFIRRAFPDASILGFIPYTSEIREADRPGATLLDSIRPELLSIFETILNRLDSSEKVGNP